MNKMRLTSLAALGLMLGVTGCASMQTGSSEAKTVATGSAGGANSQNANNQLIKCDRTLGTIAVVEDTSSPWYGILTGQYHLGSTTPVLKLLIQQSNCFVVVERGRAMGNMMQERELAQSGELRANSKFGKGQMVSADYSLSPSITFSNNNAGGFGAAIGGHLFGSVGAVVGGSLNAKEASTMLTLVDNRSGVQLAASEGSARNWDFGAVGGLLGSGFGAMGGGYANTAEGKVIVAAFMDAYNGIVRAVQNYRAQNVQGGLGTGGNLQVQGGATAGATMSIRDAQQRLNELGFSVGTPDGRMGTRTKQQLSKFQQSRRIPVTGNLDQATIDELSR